MEEEQIDFASFEYSVRRNPWQKVWRSRYFQQTLVLVILMSLVSLIVVAGLANYFTPVESKHGAYAEDWQGLSTFRTQLEDAPENYQVQTIISTPAVLNEVDDPESAVLIVSGVERAYDGSYLDRYEWGEYVHTPIERNEVNSFLRAGGTVIVMDDFGYGNSISTDYGVEFYSQLCADDEPPPCDGQEGRLWDQEYERELNVSFVWVNITQVWDTNQTSIDYNLMMNTPTALRILDDAGENRNYTHYSSNDSFLDLNGDGLISQAQGVAGGCGEKGQNSGEDDLVGPCPLILRKDIEGDDANVTGTIFFIADGGLFINGLWNDVRNSDGDRVADTDNGQFAMDLIRDALGPNADGAQIFFDESRHVQSNFVYDSYNYLYYAMVFTTKNILIEFFVVVVLLLILEVLVVRTENPEDWRHVFSVVYYGFGDTTRYGYYANPNKIKQVFLTKVRNTNALSQEEFDELTAKKLNALIQDNALSRFVFQDQSYSLEQLVKLVRRIKSWEKG